MRSLADRSLKIIRVEASNNGQRLVGMKFPVDEGALKNLRESMAAFEAKRSGNSSDLFADEAPDAIQPKSVAWITTAPKTMKSFFQTASEGGSKRPLPDTSSSKKIPKQKVQRTALKKTASKKVTAITSFFTKVSDVR
jgi:hypothetical protein